MARSEQERCAYCGCSLDEGSGKTRDHVFPRSMYPASRRTAYSPITVAACSSCNGRWSDDEEHFRNVVNSAGEFNPAAEELYHDAIQRSLRRPAGNRRIRDLLTLTEVADVNGTTRLKIYPARDPRVLDIIRKIVVGLCHYHGIATALGFKRIWVDVLRFAVPGEYLAGLQHEQREADVVEYWYGLQTEPGMHSVWILRFYGRTGFLALVSQSEEGGPPWEWVMNSDPAAP